MTEALMETTESTQQIESSGDTVKFDSTGEVEHVPASVNEAFERTFGPSRHQQNNVRHQADELVEAGETSVDEPEGVQPKPEVPVPQPVLERQKVAPAQQAETEAGVQLDPNLRLAANALGWSDEKIDSFVAASPDLAAETFSRIYDSYVNLSRQMLSHGPQVAPAAQVQQQPAAQSTESKLDKLFADLTAFGKANGEDLVERLILPLKDEIVQPFREMQAKLQAAEDRAVQSEARSTLADLRKSHTDIYGSDPNKLSLEQQKAVRELGELADHVRSVAQLKGQEMSVSDAIRRAHLLYTYDRVQERTRKELVSSVQNRQRSLTLRPNNRAQIAGKQATMGSNKSEQAAIEAYESRATELGYDLHKG